MNKQQLLLDSFKNELGESLLFSEIWNKKTKKVFAHLNSNEAYIDMVSNYLDSLEKDLDSLGFPAFDSYQITHLNMDSLHLLINFENEYILGALIDNKSFDITGLINNIIPKIIETYKILIEDD